MVKRIIQGLVFLIGFKDLSDMGHGLDRGFKVRMQS